MHRVWPQIAVVLLAASLTVFVPFPAGGEAQELSTGEFLVSRRGMPDPNFADAVILLVHYDKKSAVGLVLNRPTNIPVYRLLRELEIAKEHNDRVYLGGPVARTGVLALLRSKTKPGEARHLFDDVYLVSTGNALKQAVEVGTGPAALRLYLGYAGWGAGQLEREVEGGVWHILKADAAMVFDSDPDTLWPRLIRRTELRRVFAPSAPALNTD